MFIGRNILVIGARNSLSQQVVSSLAKFDNCIFVLDSHPDDFMRLPVDLELPETLTKESLQRIQQVIFCLEDSDRPVENFGNTGFAFKQLENLARRNYHFSETNNLTLFDFQSISPKQNQLWGPVNDVVMGGVSQSQLKIQADRALFTGYVSTENNDGVEKFELFQNYPNPFNPSTNIQFSLPEAQNVTLIVFDVSGRKVATLFDGERLSAGSHTTNFHADHLSSGVYFYRLQAGINVQIKKMLLIK